MEQTMEQMMARLLEETRINQAKTAANLKEIIAELRVWLKEIMACEEATEACLDSTEPTTLAIESEAEHEEVPKEEAAVETFIALQKQHGDQHLTIRRCGQLKKRMCHSCMA
jgi:hypothetical protein